MSIPKGIPCPTCGGVKHKTFRTRPLAGKIIRKRICQTCGQVFLTHEQFRCRGVISDTK